MITINFLQNLNFNTMKILKIMSAVALSLVLFTGCEKESDDFPNSLVNNSQGKINNPSSKSAGITVNSFNSLDSIGFYHNLFMDSLETYSYPPVSLISDVEDSVKSYTLNEFGKHFDISQSIDLDNLNEIPGFEGHYSSIDYMEYEQIYTAIDIQNSSLIIEYIDDLLALQLEGVTYSQAQDSIINLENAYISNEAGGNSDEFKTTSSILRYSFLRGYDGSDVIPTLARKWKLAIADAIGAGVGLLVGGGPIGGLQAAAAASDIADKYLDEDE